MRFLTATAREYGPLLVEAGRLAGLDPDPFTLSISSRIRYPEAVGRAIRLPDLHGDIDLYVSSFLHELQHVTDTLDEVDLGLDEMERRARARERAIPPSDLEALTLRHGYRRQNPVPTPHHDYPPPHRSDPFAPEPDEWLPPYRPDPSAPKHGEWDRSEETPRWRQSHLGLVRGAIRSWKGSPSDMRLHMQDEQEGAPIPPSGSGKFMRAQARALLWEIENNASPAPHLYRGDSRMPHGMQSWTASPRVAEHWAAKSPEGAVWELWNDRAFGLRAADYGWDMDEDEWIVVTQKGDSYASYVPRTREDEDDE